MARRLARDEAARNRRHEVISLPLKIRSVGLAIGAAADLAGIADEESAASSTERDQRERTRLLETLGADPGARTQPPHIRSQLSALEREQKARATRHGRDVVDRALVDLLSMYRDALVVRSGATGRSGQQRGHRSGAGLGRGAAAGAIAVVHGRHRGGPRADQPQRAAPAGFGSDGGVAAAADRASLATAPRSARPHGGPARDNRQPHESWFTGCGSFSGHGSAAGLWGPFGQCGGGRADACPPVWCSRS